MATINGTSKADTLNGDQGPGGFPENDIIYGKANHDVINGLFGDDELHGDSGNDQVSGGYGDDDLWGDSGNDTLDGGEGCDRINGGSGVDVMTGGGNGGGGPIERPGLFFLEGGDGCGCDCGDEFVFDKNSGGQDIITDFEVGTDCLVLENGIAIKKLSSGDFNNDGMLDTLVNFTKGAGSVVLLGVSEVSAEVLTDCCGGGGPVFGELTVAIA